MKTFFVLIKTEVKLMLRNADTLFFGIVLPIGLAILLGFIYGDKPAQEGAPYTAIAQSFGAIASIGICATSLMTLPLTVAGERDKKVLKHYKVTPVHPGMLLTVHIIIDFIVSVISSLCVFVTLALFFGYRMGGAFLPFAGSYILVSAAMFGIGALIASLCKTIKQSNTVTSLVYFPMFFLSGATVPYEIMPKPLQTAMNILPLTQGIKLLKATSLGLDNVNCLAPIIVLASIAVISIAISIKVFKWE